MALTYVGASNAAGQNAGNTGSGQTVPITPTMPASTASGDRVFIVETSTNDAGTTPTGWNEIVKNQVVGTGAVAAGSGQRIMSVYYRDYDGVWTMPSFPLVSSTAPSHWIGAVSVRRTNASYIWGTPTISSLGTDYGTANTAHSATTASSFQTHSNGFVIIGTVENDSVTSTGGTLTQSGATFGTISERCDGGTATGNDVAGKLHTTSVTTGANATLTFACTLSAASQGGTMIIEQTESQPKLENLVEDFNSIDGAIWNPTNWSAGSGVASITTPSSTANLQTDFGYDMTGSYMLFQVPTLSIVTGTATLAMFGLRDGGTNNSWGFSIQTASEIVTAIVNNSTVGSTHTHANGDWYKISEASGTIYFEWSTSGNPGTWTTLHSTTTLPTLTNVKPSFDTTIIGGSVTASIDKINIPPPPTGTIGATMQKLTSSLTGIMPLPFATFADTFDNGSSTPNAALWDVATANSGVVAVNTGTNILEFSGSHATLSPSASVYTDVQYSLDESFVVYGPVTGTFNANTSLYVYVGSGNGNSTPYYRIALTNNVQAQKDTGGGVTNVGSSTAHASGNWYRISETGGTVYFDKSSDGLNWTNFASETASFSITKLRLMLNATAVATVSISAQVAGVNAIPVTGTIGASMQKMTASLTGALSNIPTSGHIDDFDGVSTTPDTSLWTRSQVGVATVAVDTTNHELDFASGSTVSNASVTSISGSYTMVGSSLTIGPVTNVSLAATWVQFEASITDAGFTSMYRLLFTNTIGLNLVSLHRKVGATDSGIGGSFTHVNGYYYRLRESGGTVYFDRSPDNITWTNQASEATATSITDKYIYLNLATIVGGNSGTISIGGVNVQPPILSGGLFFAAYFP